MAIGGGDLSPDSLLARAPAIRWARVSRLSLTKNDPQWRFALGADPTTHGLLLELESDNGEQAIGRGTANELRHLGYRLDDLERSLVETSGKIEAGAAPDLNGLIEPVRAIVQMALLDLVSRHERVPAHRLLGTVERQRIPLTRILALKTPAEMARIAAGHVAEGYRHLKVKLDNQDASTDAARVAMIRQAVGPHVGLSLDANQSYRAEDALALCDQVARYDVLLFEQPVAADDIDGLAFLRQHSPIPIEADESANSLARVAELVSRRAVHGVSIKIAKLGGVDRALAAVRQCLDAGIDVRVGAHVGSQVMVAAAAHIAAVIPGEDRPAELGEFARLTGDPASGLTLDNGSLDVPDRDGLGVTFTRGSD